jgi:hypothetical protein
VASNLFVVSGMSCLAVTVSAKKLYTCYIALIVTLIGAGFSNIFAVDVSGRILMEGIPVSGAIVSMDSLSLKDTTGADGLFRLGDSSAGPVGIVRGSGTIQKHGLTLLFDRKGISIRTLRPIEHGSVSVYSLQGKIVSRHEFASQSAGHIRLSFDSKEKLSAGQYLVSVQAGSQNFVQRALIGDFLTTVNMATLETSGLPLGKSSAVFAGTIKIAYQDYVTTSAGIAALHGALGDIRLDSILLAQLKLRLDSLAISKYTGVTSTSNAPMSGNASWQVYTFAQSQCQCIKQGVFQVAYRTGGSTNKLVYYLQGGGACWPGMTSCTETVAFDVANEPYASSSNSNPVAGWPFVYVPYCDGSVHMGDNIADDDNNGSAESWHWGLRNNSAGIAIAKLRHPSLDTVFIVGRSAGGFGTATAAMLMRSAYPAARIYVINDAGPGLFNPSRPDVWNAVVGSWKMTDYFPQECDSCTKQIIYLYDWQLSRDPRLKVGLYSAYQDLTIGFGFLGMFPAAYQTLLVNTSANVHARHPSRFERFFETGTHHCAPNLGTSVNGVSLAAWMARMLKGESIWVDVLE